MRTGFAFLVQGIFKTGSFWLGRLLAACAIEAQARLLLCTSQLSGVSLLITSSGLGATLEGEASADWDEWLALG